MGSKPYGARADGAGSWIFDDGAPGPELTDDDRALAKYQSALAGAMGILIQAFQLIARAQDQTALASFRNAIEALADDCQQSIHRKRVADGN